ncbi:MAG: RNA-binding protein [Drouetiella hepatica Uher 2000/2452]|jgi:spoIIIJ-associated protein|uniref:RNA-binding protein n=1 Tax=Drouetiella hepatica Uher 2000/2452 TaxID=904376 RepID=A0A951QDQ5_9CYAN|nr:RNA-binding protein [Drouetiella hepatica Uher 2000/2452]
MNEALVQRGKQWLEDLMQLMSLPTQVDVHDRVEAEGSYWLTISDTSFTPEQTQSIIGKDGAVLDAIQYLANTTLNLGQAEGSQQAYTIELAGYRVRRQAELQAIADQAAQQVRETGNEYEMKALSAAERRQVHTYLKTFGDLETESRGREPDRRLVVRLALS